MRALVRTPISLLTCAAALVSAIAPAQAKLRVVATVPDLAAIARAVAGPRAEVFALTLPTQDPHYVDARPHLVLKLNRADLLLLVGLELEVGWLPVLLTGARNAKIQQGNDGYLDCSAHVALREVPQARIDRSMGDIHPGGNPHYLTDPENAIRLARVIARRLGRLDEEGREHYASSAARFAAALQARQRAWAAQLAPHRGTQVVAYHKSWAYFVEAMGLRVLAHLEPKPGIPPNAAHVLRVVQTMRRERVPVLLQEEYYPDRTAKLVADKTGARLLVLQGGTHLDAGDGYLERMDRMVAALVAGLKGARR